MYIYIYIYEERHRHRHRHRHSAVYCTGVTPSTRFALQTQFLNTRGDQRCPARKYTCNGQYLRRRLVSPQGAHRDWGQQAANKRGCQMEARRETARLRAPRHWALAPSSAVINNQPATRCLARGQGCRCRIATGPPSR